MGFSPDLSLVKRESFFHTPPLKCPFYIEILATPVLMTAMCVVYSTTDKLHLLAAVSICLRYIASFQPVYLQRHCYQQLFSWCHHHTADPRTNLFVYSIFIVFFSGLTVGYWFPEILSCSVRVCRQNFPGHNLPDSRCASALTIYDVILGVQGPRPFKVIGVYIPKKLVASACYDKQHACVYLQPFSR